MSRMEKRIVFGAIMIAALAAVLWADWRLEQWVENEVARAHAGGHFGISPILGLVGMPTAILVAIIVLPAFLEFRKMAPGAGAGILPVSGILACLVLIASVQTCHVGVGVYLLGYVLVLLQGAWVLGFLLALIFAEQMLRYRKEGALARISVTALAVLYLGVCGAVVLQIRLEYGLSAFVLLLVAAKFTDIGAYFTGSFIGRHKLIPWLSPGKSWEGLIGGIIIAAACCAGVVGGLVNNSSMGSLMSRLNAWHGAIFGAVVGLAGQFADLCESLLKRSANLKDSGAVVPEFGGVLDIIDSVLLSAPVAAILLAVLTR